MLLDGELRAKVSDFGRTRDIRETYDVFQSVRKVRACIFFNMRIFEISFSDSPQSGKNK